MSVKSLHPAPASLGLPNELSGVGLPYDLTGVELYENVVADPPSVEELQGEVQFAQALHKGGALPRLFAVQAETQEDSGLVPLYRHPLDEPHPLTMPFSPAVLQMPRDTRG